MIVYDFSGNKSFNAFYINFDSGLKDYRIDVSNDLDNWDIVMSGEFSSDVSSWYYEFGKIITAQYLRIVFKNSLEHKVNINEFKVYLVADEEEIAKIDAEKIALQSYVNNNISLPKTGDNGTQFIWESSNESVMSSDGVVTKQSKNTEVKLTLFANINNSKIKLKEFSITVEGNSGSSGPSVISGGSSSSSGGNSSSVSYSENVGDGFVSSRYAGENYIFNEIGQGVIYKDVLLNDWFYDVVKRLTELGVVSGDGSGYFYPNDNVTREQFLKMVVCSLGIDAAEATESPFDDVEANSWYKKYVDTAYKYNWVKGISRTEFGIGQNITREDMAVIIANVLDAHNYIAVKDELFKDTIDISGYAVDSVYSIKSKGIVSGYDGFYNPKSYLTRAEAASVIASLMNYIEISDVTDDFNDATEEQTESGDELDEK